LNVEVSLRVGTRNELTPRTLPLTRDAYEVWRQFHDNVEPRLAHGQVYAPIRGFGAKAAEHAARIAGVMAIFENPAALHVHERHMESGCELAKYYLREWLRLTEAGAEDPDIALAEKLLEWAQEYEEIYPVQVYQHGPYAVRDKKTASRLVTIL